MLPSTPLRPAPAPPREPRALFAPLGARPLPVPPALAGGDPSPARESGLAPPDSPLGCRAITPEGWPIAGASVHRRGRLEVTGADGRFDIPRGSGNLKVSHPDFFPREIAAAELARASSRAPFTVILARGLRISGRVLDGAGRPVPQAHVFFGEAEAPVETLTAPDGGYESPLLPLGIRSLFVAHPQYQPVRQALALAEPARPGERLRSDVTLLPGERLAVRVTGAAGEPVPDAEVWLVLTGGEHGPASRDDGPLAGRKPERRFLGRTGDLGSLETRRPPGRAATVRVRVAGYRQREVPAAGEEAHLSLEPAPALRGHAVDHRSGLPVAVSSAWLEVLAGEAFEASPDDGCLCQSLSPGKFVIGLPPRAGTYRVAAAAEGNRFGFSEAVETDGKTSPPPLVVPLSLRIEVHGLVRGPEGPCPGARVELLLVPGEPELLPPEFTGVEPPAARLRRLHGVLVPAPLPVASETRADGTGRFAFRGLEPGSYRLRAAAGGLPASLSPALELPGWEGDYPIFLRRGARLAGTLLDGEGLPEPGIPIVLTRGEEPARVAWTGVEGRFEFQDLSPGDGYSLTAGDADGTEGRPELTALNDLALEEGRDLFCRLRRKESPLGSLAGRVEVDGLPARDAVIRLRPARAGAEGIAGAACRTGEGGEFLLRGIQPGTYAIASPDLPALTHQAGELAIDAGRRTRLDLSLKTLRYRLRFTAARTGLAFAGEAEVELRRLEPADGVATGEEAGPPGGAPPAAWTARARGRGGEMEIGGLFPGSYHLQVRVRGLLHHQRQFRLDSDREDTCAIDEGSDFTVRLLIAEGEPFRGDAEVVLRKDGLEVLRARRFVAEELVVPTAGPGDYELTVRSADRSTQVRFKVESPALEDSGTE